MLERWCKGIPWRWGSEQDLKGIIFKKKNNSRMIPNFRSCPTSIAPDKLYVPKKKAKTTKYLIGWFSEWMGLQICLTI